MKAKHYLFKLGILFILAFASVAGCAVGEGEEGQKGGEQAGEEGETKDVTITFGVTPWSSTVPPTHIAKLILEDMGYTVETMNADAGGVYTGLSRGDIDVFMDAWLPDMHNNYMEQFGESIDDTAVSYPDGELGWVIPTYVEGIDSIEDIKGREAEFEGNMYGIEEGAGMTLKSRDMIADYGLDLEYVASSEAGMMAEASRKMQKNEPVLFLGWRPHPMFANYDLKVLEDPKEYFKTSEVHVITNKELKEKAPEAFDFLKNWSIDVGDIESMIVEIDNGKDPEEVAKTWIEKNEDKVKEMKPKQEEGGSEEEGGGEEEKKEGEK